MKNNVIKYKGYSAKVRYSKTDKCYCGWIEGLEKDSISFEGDTIEELEKDFRDAIDHYLECCKNTNTEPDKQCSEAYEFKAGAELHADAKRVAKNNKISLNELTRRALRAYIYKV